MSLSRLNIFLLKDSVVSAADAIRSDKKTVEIAAAASSGITGSFFYARSGTNPPGWVAEMDTVLAGSISNVVSASAAGVFVLQTSGRWFAVSFGYGRSLLEQSEIVRKFGLRVGLNLVDPSQLRSMDTKTFEDLVVSRATQSSKSSDLPAFGIDVSKDILRGVAGKPQDANFARRLAGSDAIILVKTVEVSDLPTVCDELLSAYKSTHYKNNFAWIDQLAIIEDTKLLETLNTNLINALRKKDTSATYMAAPEALDWEDIAHFKVSGTYRETYDDLDLDAYLAKLNGKKVATLELEELKRRSVTVVYSRSGNEDNLWNIYQCLISEQQMDGQLYVLIEGNWFAVDKSLSEQVNHYFNDLDKTTTLTDAGPDETEPEFNLRMVAEHPGEYLHLDAKILRPGGAASGIEVCDLLAKDGTFIHIKRKSRSSTLSHLFAQGSVSATSLVSDGVFRDEVRKVIVKQVPAADAAPWLDLIPPSAGPGVDATKLKVSYVVLTKPTTSTDWMPFFSKLNLMQHAKQLQTMRFEVSVSRLDN